MTHRISSGSRRWVALTAIGLLVGTTACSGDDGTTITADTTPPATDVVTTVPPGTTVPPVTTTVAPPPDFPDGSQGPFGVGHTTITIPATDTAPALTADVWYPSADVTAPPTYYELLPLVGATSPDAREDAAPADGPFPLMVYSHGSGAFRIIATEFTENMASHGFVVAAVDHPGDTLFDVFATGGQPDIYRATVRRVDDLTRLVDAVTAESAGDSVAFAGAVDPTRLVVTGHSLGGAGALKFAASHPEVDAVVAMDPTITMMDPGELGAISAPVLFLVGDAFENSNVIQTDQLQVPWYQVHIPTASHNQFTDVCLYADYLPGWIAAGAAKLVTDYAQSAVDSSCGPAQIDGRRAHQLIDAYTMAFLNLTLGGDPAWADTLLSEQPDAYVVVGG